MPLSFQNPWALLALLLVPWFLWMARGSRAGLEPGRAAAAMVIRLLLLGAVVMALADAQWLYETRRTCTLFLVDDSFSIPPEKKKGVLEFVQQKLKELPDGDHAGVIVFGGDAMIEVPPSATPRFDQIHSFVQRSATDLSAAVRLGMAAFPSGYHRRMILMTDGNENRGEVLPEIERARAHGIEVDVIPLGYEYPGEVWIQGLHVPAHLDPKEPFEVTVVVQSEAGGPATLQLSRNGTPVAVKNLQLDKGKNVFILKEKIPMPGPYTYEAVVVARDGRDVISQNNRAFAFTASRGGSKVLIVADPPPEGEPPEHDHLARALAEEGLSPVVMTSDELLARIPEVPEYDLLILVNVPASNLRTNVMHAIEGAVRDAGTGLIAIGGQNSYGPGGYRGTPLEETLPVSMEQPQHRVIPNGALVLILHTCEFADGNYWAKQIALAALNVLTPKDYMGVLYYSMRGEEWLFKPTLAANKAHLAKLIRDASPDDMPSFDGTLQMAHEELVKLEAGTKHIVVISDADPAGPSPELLQAIVKDRISISTVAIQPHSDSDVQKMQAAANVGKGRFYFVDDPTKLPRIFVKEAAVVQRTMVIEDPFRPIVVERPDFLKGIDAEALPPLRGYVLANPKPQAQITMRAKQNDPLLVEWRAGLGKAVAWMSDAKPRWAAEWVAWPQFRKFWAQLARTAVRTVQRGEYAMTVNIDKGRGHVVVDAIEPDGRLVHSLTFRGSVSGPEGSRMPLEFRQTGPGRYEATFEPGEVGIYTVNAAYENERGERGFLTQGTALPYVLEYRDLKTDEALLQRIVDTSGGRLIRGREAIYSAPRRPTASPWPLWPLLLALLAVLFPLDVFVRRVALEWSHVAGLWAWIRRRPKAAEAAPATPLTGLVKRKRELREAVRPVAMGERVDLYADLGAPPQHQPAAKEVATAAPPPKAKPAAPPAKQMEEADYLKRLLDAKRKAKKED